MLAQCLRQGGWGGTIQSRLNGIDGLHLVQIRVAGRLSSVWVQASDADTSTATIALLCLFTRDLWIWERAVRIEAALFFQCVWVI
jgi:hypothetical protein